MISFMDHYRKGRITGTESGRRGWIQRINREVLEVMEFYFDKMVATWLYVFLESYAKKDDFFLKKCYASI